MRLYDIIDWLELEHRREQGIMCENLARQLLDARFPEVNANTWKGATAGIGPCIVKAKGEVIA